jgi:hypothetical protein
VAGADLDPSLAGVAGKRSEDSLLPSRIGEKVLPHSLS